MTIGATQAGDRPEAEDAAEAGPESWAAAPRPQLPALIREPNDRLVPALLILAGVAWLALAGWGAATAVAGRTLNVAVIASWLSVALAPLALPAILWTAWLRRPSRMRHVHESAAAELRREAMILDHLFGRLAARSAEAQGQLAEQAALLRNVGDETGRRVLSVGETLREGSALLSRHAVQLDDAAESARADLGVLIADLPEAEARVAALISRVQALGGEVGGQAATLAARVGSLDEQQQGLRSGAAELVRALDEARARGRSLASDLGDAGDVLETRVGSAAALAVDGMEAVRAGGAAQAAALSALVEQTRAAVEAAGAEALASLRRRSAACVAEVEAIGRALDTGDEAARALTAGLTRDLAELEARQVALSESGLQRTRALQAATSDVIGDMERLTGVIAASDLAGGAAVSRAEALSGALDQLAERLVEGLPPLLADTEMRAGALGDEVGRAVAALETIGAAVAREEGSLARLSSDAAARLEDVERRAADADQRLARMAQTAAALAGSIETAGADAVRFSEQAGPQLLDALVRVRESANQAAERAREALATAVQPLAATLESEGRHAVEVAIDRAMAGRGAQLSDTAERALASAVAAGEQLDLRLIALNQALDRADARIAAGLQAAEQAGDNSFSRRMTLLIESLNSTAIDVTKVLSNEVTDAAWAAYLKGDRGVFARRAVRLLEAGEAREIVRHYEAEPEFRGQVDRYIHDFEAMLRDVLAFRPGTPVGVTLLSSDVGKLYVALAQAIERLRA